MVCLTRSEIHSEVMPVARDVNDPVKVTLTYGCGRLSSATASSGSWFLRFSTSGMNRAAGVSRNSRAPSGGPSAGTVGYMRWRLQDVIRRSGGW